MSSTLIPTINFSDLTKADISKVGTKAANIAELYKAKIPVPPGFIITSESYYYFLDMAKIREKIVDILTNLDVNNTKELEEASNLIQDMILKSTIPPVIENSVLKSYSRLSGLVNSFVAVRSSIAYDGLESDSFAGMSSTFLNIKGGKDVVLALKACWASLFEPNSIYYRSAKGISHVNIGMGIIIQKMVQAEVSGVMFTLNPVNADQGKLIIESVLGLGDIVESDAISPDHYELDKSQNRVDVKRVAKQPLMIIRSTKHKENEEQIKKVRVAEKWQNVQKLEDRKITELGSIGKLIEQQFGEPQDIEWAMEGNKVYILQTRSLAIEKTATLESQLNDQLKEKTQEVTEFTPPSVQEEVITAPVEETNGTVLPDLSADTTEKKLILSGSPASEGVIKGIVKIVKTHDDFMKLNTGDILVIDKIIPDYILWMRKAGGIITNEGGMTSHSAILSREFKIPCIVGTENATEMLIDGQIVEIDGSNGRVYAIAQDFTIPPITPLEHIPQTESEIKIQPQLQMQDTIIPPAPITQTPVVPQVPPIIQLVHDDLVPEIKEDFIPHIQPQAQVVYEKDMHEEAVAPKEVHFNRNIKTATKIMVNLAETDIASSIAEKGADGIGFLNGTAILNQIIKKHPEAYLEEESVEKYVSELSHVLESLAKTFNPYPIIYRPSNLIAHELSFNTAKYETEEANPKLGYNGAMKYVQNPYLFNMEIEAIKTTRNRYGLKNLSLLLPMIRTDKDLREIKKIITSNDLKRSSTFKVYLPIEAPSAMLLIDDMIDIGIDGIFIFVRSLSGYLNAIDLDNPKYKDYPVFNESFMVACESLIKTAHKHKIPCGIILEDGEFDEDILHKLILWGALYISINPYYLEKTKAITANIEKNIILSKRR